MTAAEFSQKLRVYIEDTDAGGIVYYVNYLKFMERARTEFMRRLGFGRNTLLSSDRMFVVSDANVQFLAPARLDDELEATAAIARLRGAGMVFCQGIRRGSQLLARGEITVACVDRATLKPRRLPSGMAARLRLTLQSERKS